MTPIYSDLPECLPAWLGLWAYARPRESLALKAKVWATSNAEEAEVEWFYEDLQDLLELTPQKMSFSLCVSEVTQSCLTLCDPVNSSLPGPSVHGILQARVLEWVAIAFSIGLHRTIQFQLLHHYWSGQRLGLL